MLSPGLELSRRLEAAEGHACMEFAKARYRLSPAAGAAWLQTSGTFLAFDGVDSPVTQTFALGLFEDLTPEALDRIEQFFIARDTTAVHEVSPLAGIPTLDLLCARGYRPIEQSTVMHQLLPVTSHNPEDASRITARIATPKDRNLWAGLSAQGWAGSNPELEASIRDFGQLAFSRDHTISFLAELNGLPAATASLCLHDGVALFAGASTIPGMRCRGLQSALLAARLRHAAELGCDLAMMVTEVGSQSQRNAERAGFRVAYTRTKWRLAPETPRILNP